MEEIKNLIVFEKGIIKDAENVFKKIKRINIDFNQENFIVLGLSTKNQVLFKENMFKGSIDSAIIDSRLILKKAILKNCPKIIIAHNHPSNNLTPSSEDIDIYHRLKDACEMMQIDILDAITFNKKQFYSYKDN